LVTDSIKALRKLAEMLPHENCPWDEQPTFKAPKSEDLIIKLQEEAGFSFPTDLLAFFSEVDSIVGMSVHNGYWIGDVQKLSDMHSARNFPRIINDYKAIPIATDGGGNGFLIDSSGYVWNWNHGSEQLKQVSDSFTGFLERVVEDWEAFVFSRLDWEYLV